MVLVGTDNATDDRLVPGGKPVGCIPKNRLVIVYHYKELQLGAIISDPVE
jgi:hypothetical protein